MNLFYDMNYRFFKLKESVARYVGYVSVCKTIAVFVAWKLPDRNKAINENRSGFHRDVSRVTRLACCWSGVKTLFDP